MTDVEPDVTLDEIHRRFPKDVTDEQWRRQIARLRLERASWQEKSAKRERKATQEDED